MGKGGCRRQPTHSTDMEHLERKVGQSQAFSVWLVSEHQDTSDPWWSPTSSGRLPVEVDGSEWWVPSQLQGFDRRVHPSVQRFPWFEGKLSFGDEVSTGWGNWLTAHTCEARSCSRLLQAHGSFEVLLLAGTGDTCRAASNKLRPSFPGVVGISKSNTSWVAQIPSSFPSPESSSSFAFDPEAPLLFFGPLPASTPNAALRPSSFPTCQSQEACKQDFEGEQQEE